MGRRLTALLLIVLLTACGDDAVMVPLPPTATILAFGDSLTAGNGAPAGGSYPVQLANLIGRTVINEGISGEESGEGRQRLEMLLDRHRPSLLILCHGGNDLLRKRPLTQLENNLKAMIGMADARGIPVLMLGVPAPGIFLSSNEVYEKVAEATGVAFIPEIIADVLSEPALKGDTIHPNAAGYARIAAAVQQELERLGAI